MHIVQSRESNDHRKWPAAGFVRTIVQSSLQQQKASDFWKSEKLIIFSLSLIIYPFILMRVVRHTACAQFSLERDLFRKIHSSFVMNGTNQTSRCHFSSICNSVIYARVNAKQTLLSL